MEVNLYGNMDAHIWAQEFMKIYRDVHNGIVDESIMLGWFANAIMTGYDTGWNRVFQMFKVEEQDE